MKNLKYRSVISVFAAILLSVFLFTGCEKDAAEGPTSSNGDMIEKFKRLKFQTVTTTKGNASGQFVGTGNGTTNFVEPNSSSGSFASSTGANNMFTDPTSSSYSFGVNGSFGFGGGSFTLNGKKTNLAFGFCGSDIFGELDSIGELDEVDIFIGVAGDFDVTENDTSSSEEDGIDYIVYAFSYNGGTTLSNFAELDDEDNLDNLAFVMLIEYDERDPKFYLSTGGSIVFSDNYLTLSSVSLVDDEGHSGGNLDASFECVNYEDMMAN